MPQSARAIPAMAHAIRDPGVPLCDSGNRAFAAIEADLPADRRHFHVLRHSAAVHVLDAGEDIDFARDHLGHRSIQSTMTYAQVSDARRNRKIRRLERSREFRIPS
jgi:integrase